MKMSCTNITEIKRRIETEILKLIQEFENETGLTVKEVFVDGFQGGRTDFVLLRID